MYERGYWLDGLDKSRNADVLQAVKKYWSANGFVITYGGDRPVGKGFTVAARQASTQYKMLLVDSDVDTLDLSVQSPCVYPESQRSASPTTK